MRMRGNLSAVEDEWHIRGIAPWVDPIFTFQRTWYPDDTPPSINFNATLAKVFSLFGGGLAGYFVWQKTGNKVYTGIAGAAGVVVAPMLVSAYDYFSRPEGDVIEERATGPDITLVPDPDITLVPDPDITLRPDTTLVPGSASPKDPQAQRTLAPIVPDLNPSRPNATSTSVPTSVVVALGDFLLMLYESSGRNPHMLSMFISGTMLKRAIPRTGSVPSAKVSEALHVMDTSAQSFVSDAIRIYFLNGGDAAPDEVLRGVTIAGLLRSIEASSSSTGKNSAGKNSAEKNSAQTQLTQKRLI